MRINLSPSDLLIVKRSLIFEKELYTKIVDDISEKKKFSKILSTLYFREAMAYKKANAQINAKFAFDAAKHQIENYITLKEKSET